MPVTGVEAAGSVVIEPNFVFDELERSLIAQRESSTWTSSMTGHALVAMTADAGQPLRVLIERPINLGSGRSSAVGHEYEISANVHVGERHRPQLWEFVRLGQRVWAAAQTLVG
jgi:hypothetical protein